MTIFPLSYPRGRMIRIPTRAELRDHMDDPRTMRTAIVCVTIAFLPLLGLSAWIIASGHDLYVLTAAIVTPVLAFLGMIAKRLRAQEKRLDEIASNQPTMMTGPAQ